MNNESIQSPLLLHAIISRISISSLPSAIRKHSFIVNDIPSDLQVNMNEHMLATIFGSLLNTVINHTENCCIRISAKLYGKEVLINLKERYRVNGHAFAGNLKEIQQLAEKIGGTVTLSNDRTRITTVFLSFVNGLCLAA